MEEPLQQLNDNLANMWNEVTILVLMEEPLQRGMAR